MAVLWQDTFCFYIFNLVFIQNFLSFIMLRLEQKQAIFFFTEKNNQSLTHTVKPRIPKSDK